MSEPKPLRTSDVAKIIGRSPSYIRQLEREGAIGPFPRDRANQRRFSERDVERISEAILAPSTIKT
jgi:DNA-binding transcriptional MerR regulator